jgi:beta-carotene hydroxylase
VIAWPTMFLFAVSLAIIAVACTMTLSGKWPLWLATLANGFAMYTLFSVAHDGSHRAISKYPLVNETIGRIAIMLLLPVAPFEAVRWLHMQHHRLTNSANDPDQFVHQSNWWSFLFTWPNIDAIYLYYFITRGGEHLRKNLRPVVVYSVVFIGMIAVLTARGYGAEVLFLWFFASRLGLLLIALVFIYLPHHPGNVSVDEDVYRASTIRRGWEWLLTPLLVFQNYHLIHHLYPTAPFYTYLKIWHLKYEELVSKNPAVQEAFSMARVTAENKIATARVAHA